MNSRVVVGVDIGDDSVRAVEVTGLDKERPTVVRYREISLPEGAVKDGEVAEVNTVAAALRQLWSAGGFRSKKIVLGVGNSKVLVRDLTVPRLGAKEIRQSLPSHVQDMLPVPVADALLDFYPISESTSEAGPVVHGLLVAAIKDAVKANVTAAQLAGLSPVAMDLIPFALSRLHARDHATAPWPSSMSVRAPLTWWSPRTGCRSLSASSGPGATTSRRRCPTGSVSRRNRRAPSNARWGSCRAPFRPNSVSRPR